MRWCLWFPTKVFQLFCFPLLELLNFAFFSRSLSFYFWIKLKCDGKYQKHNKKQITKFSCYICTSINTFRIFDMWNTYVPSPMIFRTAIAVTQFLPLPFENILVGTLFLQFLTHTHTSRHTAYEKVKARGAT